MGLDDDGLIAGIGKELSADAPPQALESGTFTEVRDGQPDPSPEAWDRTRTAMPETSALSMDCLDFSGEPDFIDERLNQLAAYARTRQGGLFLDVDFG